MRSLFTEVKCIFQNVYSFTPGAFYLPTCQYRRQRLEAPERKSRSLFNPPNLLRLSLKRRLKGVFFWLVRNKPASLDLTNDLALAQLGAPPGGLGDLPRRRAAAVEAVSCFDRVRWGCRERVPFTAFVCRIRCNYGDVCVHVSVGVLLIGWKPNTYCLSSLSPLTG